MRHLKAGRKLNRNSSHRLALYRSLAMALFQHERIITTVAKAKAVRPFVEKLITLAKRAHAVVAAAAGKGEAEEKKAKDAVAAKAAKKASPAVLKTWPFLSSISLRRSSSWRAIASRMGSGNFSQRSVDASTCFSSLFR